jgi:hypothetical protein
VLRRGYHPGHGAQGRPAGVPNVPEPGTDSELAGVSCASAKNCWAVGDYQSSAGAGLNQALHWNGRKWSQVGRAGLAAAAGLAEWISNQRELRAQPGRRRVRGIAAQSVFTALLLAAANIRKIRAWRELTPAGKTRIDCRARRRRASLGDYLPDG